MTSISSASTPLMPASGRLRLQAATLLFVACAALCTFTGGLLYSEYLDAKASRHAELLNLSSSVLRSVESSVTYANMILVGLAERYRYDGGTPENLARMLGIARTRVDWQPEIQGVFFYGADGRWLMTTLSAVTPQRNNSDREYFQYHLKNESLAPYIGPPIRSRTTGEWIMTVSIRLEDANGAFAGVALATLQVENFLEFFRSLELGKDGIVNMARNDGVQLVRYPFSPELIAVNVNKAPVAKAIQAGSTRGVLAFNSPVDGAKRMVGYASSSRYPIRLSVGMTEDYAFASWRRGFFLTFIATTAALGVIIFLGFRTVRGIQQRANEELVLRADNGELQLLATEDGLTGLANRRHFDQVLAKSFDQAKSNQTPIALLLLDIDHFKKYNDTYGHPAGDECLRRVATLVRNALGRPTDLAARYGGEEIAVIFPSTDLKGAMLLAEEIRTAVEQANIESSSVELGRVTVSIGVAGYIPVFDYQSHDELLLLTDKALYMAKKNGRNLVTGYPEG
ncbi:diguanylate cyclase [Pseudomonas asturiensis]|uniref:diguanylate cyclase n=1 Tax=Pseudomonas asturiensis TaxID=1190415 RepID=A0ABX6H6Y9_9PSED|nr:sensor domain-containing diguanylate cyclase [Pseudomonas asturiensis]QHF01203.1 diguanylate cyclase [Pseudomonas asturiensis]